ncbi:MAG: hypothetical protein AMXMBFR64_54750 [Myxococcales bacterium]
MKKLMALIGFMALPAAAAPPTLGSLSAGDLVGCFAVAPDGSKMACASHERGMAYVEVKGTVDRRVFKTWPTGEGRASTAAPASKVREIAKWLQSKGFVPTAPATRTDRGLRLPGMTCSLAVNPEGTAVLTLPDSGGDGRPWVLIDGHGGGSVLSGLSADSTHDRALLALDHTTREGDTVVREVKLLPLADLGARSECKGPAQGE